MTIHERQEIAEAILNELHFRRYNEAVANGCNEKDAMTLADNWELYKDAQSLFKFYVDLAIVSERFNENDMIDCWNSSREENYLLGKTFNEWLNEL